MPKHEVYYYPEGEAVGPDVLPGDVYLTSGAKLPSRLIQLAQRLRYGRDVSRWNHAGIFTGHGTQTVESLEWGPEYDDIRRYTDSEVAVIRIYHDDRDREQVMAFVESCVREKKRYSYLTILAILISLLTGSRLQFSRAGTNICSGLVADALTRAGFIWPRPPAFCLPADLAEVFGVGSPSDA